MLKEFNWLGGYYSKKADNHEVTVEETSSGYLVSLWKGETKDLLETQDFAGKDLNTLLRSLALADQLVKQNKKSHSAGKH